MWYSSTVFTRGKKLSHPLFVISCTLTLTPGISFTKTHVTCFIILSSFIPHIYPSIHSVSSPPLFLHSSIPFLLCMCLRVLLDRREYFVTAVRDGQLKSSAYSGKHFATPYIYPSTLNHPAYNVLRGRR